jgi:HEPN domain-containing protein
MHILQIQPRANIIPIDSWRDYRRDGEQFLKTAADALRKGNRRFTPEILYNLVAMAIEKLVMAFLMKRGDLAENHTMGDLLHAMEKHIGHHPELAEQFTYLDSFQEICEIETYRRQVPTAEETAKIVAIGLDIQRLLTPHLL